MRRGSWRGSCTAACCRATRGSIFPACSSRRRRSPRRTGPTSTSPSRRKLDYLALSFVRRAEDIEELRALVPQAHAGRREDREGHGAREHREHPARSDAVMVARGDLGVELPFEEVPIAQKRIISLANAARPAGDHGHADARIDDRESATHARRGERRRERDSRWHRCGDAVRGDGRRAVSASSRCEAMTPHHHRDREHPAPRQRVPIRAAAPRRRAVPTEDAIAAATVAAVDMLARAARHRLHEERLQCARGGLASAGSPDPGADRRRAHVPPARARVGGAFPSSCRTAGSYDEMVGHALTAALPRRGSRQEGERVVVTAGVPFDIPGTTNMMKVEDRCEADLPRHRHELRGAAARMSLRGLPFARSARPRTRVGALVETDDGTRILIDTPPELRLQLIAGGHRPRRRGVLHARSCRPHARHRRPPRDLGAPRRAAADVRRTRTRSKRLAQQFPYIFDDNIRPLPGTSKPEGHARPLTDGESVEHRRRRT